MIFFWQAGYHGIMLATLNMAKKPTTPKTGPVQGRLTLEEIAELDRIAASQFIPVDRGSLVSHVLREWLKQQREGQGKKGGR